MTGGFCCSLNEDCQAPFPGCFSLSSPSHCVTTTLFSLCMYFFYMLLKCDFIKAKTNAIFFLCSLHSRRANDWSILLQFASSLRRYKERKHLSCMQFLLGLNLYQEMIKLQNFLDYLTGIQMIPPHGYTLNILKESTDNLQCL